MDKRAWTLLAMCLAVLMVQLDTTVVNLALRPIQRGLHTDVATLQWVVDAYNLVYATFILTGATLGDRYGRKRLFLWGAGLFAAGSLLSVVAPDAGLLVASRAITGFGAAVALPVSLAIVTAAYEGESRNRAIAIWSGVNGVAIALGPSAGGALVDHFGWRSVFALFIPVACAAFALTAVVVAESRSKGTGGLDASGQILAVLSLGAFSFAAIEGPKLHAHGLPLGALALALCAFAGFIAVEWRARTPLVDLRLFANAGFSAACAVTLAMTFGMYTFLFIVPNYVQTSIGLSALATGLLLLPLGVVFAVLSPFSARWVNVFGPRFPIAAGMGLQAIGLATSLAFGARGPIWLVVVSTALLGFALGCETGPLMSVAMASSPKDRFGMASGIVNVMRLTGATVGVAVLGSIFASRAGAGGAGGLIAGMHAALAVATGVAVAATAIALGFVPRRSVRSPARNERAHKGAEKMMTRA